MSKKEKNNSEWCKCPLAKTSNVLIVDLNQNKDNGKCEKCGLKIKTIFTHGEFRINYNKTKSAEWDRFGEQ